ncbi:XRE family transcriptional regulator [Streptomyces sp. NPDC101227]|uniref:XRE family transcriptional regulator n=1 Tax=Streptomyces sp. NPDC101227 TaxID=3366136 RepID=UPI003815A9B4
MDATRNVPLEAWMQEHGFSSNTLADAVNQAIGDLTGKVGGLDGASVRDWKAGRVRWPKSATRAALEEVTGLDAAALGFVPRRRRSPIPAPPQEDPDMHRRTVITGVPVALAVAAAPAVAAPRRVGMSDVGRLQRRFAEIVARDHRHGGQLTIEQRAAALADEALALNSAGSATQRVRGQIYASAASFRSSAMWAAIDGRRFGDAQTHMREAQALAEMSGDQAIKFRIWSHVGTMYRHMNRPGDARAANDVARGRSITRRDPMFASLGLARQAAIHGAAGDRTATRIAFDQAQAAMNRATADAYRPVWMTAFYDQAELNSLALSAYLALLQWETAESHGYRCLAALRPHMRRSRGIATARLARAQLGQRDTEPAVATAMSIPLDAVRHPRVADMLSTFGVDLRRFAPTSPHTVAWTQYEREALP